MIKIKRREIKLCECGCGQPVKNRFVSGHNRCKYPHKDLAPPQLCQCGCGKITNIGKKFITGHNSKTEEARLKSSKRNKGKPSWNAGLTKETDERVMKISNSLSGKIVSEETKSKMRGKKNSKEQNQNHSIKMKELWQTPEYREKQLSIRNDNEYKNILSGKISKSVTELWQDSLYRESMMKAREDKGSYKKSGITYKKNWENPEFVKAHSGENAWNWQGGLSFQKYTQEWSKKLREQIRERDGHICQVCLISQDELDRKLHIHHIDYDKKNCNEDNLISLCPSCHMKTTNKNNREQWQLVFASQ